jgi:hypothetical protein
MTDKLDQIALSEVLDIYKEISSMLKSLEDKEKQIAESEKND